MIDTEDKLAWCEAGEAKELPFVAETLMRIGLGAMINPAKRENKYSHDAFAVLPMDVKSVETPLFVAKQRYNIDPQYAVTFNEKDLNRYESYYPKLIVMFHVRWAQTEMELGGRIYSVEPMNGIWYAPVEMIRRFVNTGRAKVIEYKNRVNDTKGNAKSSFVFDVRWFYELARIDQ